MEAIPWSESAVFDLGTFVFGSFITRDNLYSTMKSSSFTSFFQFSVTRNAFSRVPTPLPVDAPLGLFSEGRAFQTTSYLADTIGHRQVGTPGEEYAAQYLLQQSLTLVEYAKLHRPDLHVMAVREQVQGAIGLQKVFGQEIANVYNNLTNIILKIAPINPDQANANAIHDTYSDGTISSSEQHQQQQEQHLTPKSLLINAHYDSSMATTGASDAASCVGIALEIARTIIYNGSLTLHAPIVFLFNGGEETLMQARWVMYWLVGCIGSLVVRLFYLIWIVFDCMFICTCLYVSVCCKCHHKTFLFIFSSYACCCVLLYYYTYRHSVEAYFCSFFQQKNIPIHSLTITKKFLCDPRNLIFQKQKQSLPCKNPIICSHGFMSSSSFAGELGAFINLESTGPWGEFYFYDQLTSIVECV